MQNFTIHNLKKAKKNKEGTCFPFSFEVEKMRWEGYKNRYLQRRAYGKDRVGLTDTYYCRGRNRT